MSNFLFSQHLVLVKNFSFVELKYYLFLSSYNFGLVLPEAMIMQSSGRACSSQDYTIGKLGFDFFRDRVQLARIKLS